jgi:glycolate oxidase iron-sulfur subunit
VQYGQLLEAARAELNAAGAGHGTTGRMLRFTLRHVWLHPRRLRAAFTLARQLRDTKLARLLRKTRLPRLFSKRFDFALALLDSSSPVEPDQRRDAGGGARTKEAEGGATALLFKGCVTEGLFARVKRATARVLEVNGCGTGIPSGQVCCGALHAHAGELEGARTLARLNLEAFAGDESLPLVTNAGGCGAMLKSYAELLADDPEYAERAARFSRRVRDVSQQLALTGLREGAGLDQHVTTYDASCHLLYGQRAVEEPLGILRAIPGLRFVALEGSERCCGGAGVYNLLEPGLSRRVLDEKLAHIRETGARLLATGNPGCHMQIGAGAEQSGLSLSLCHPVELLDQSYRRAGFYLQREETASK